MLQKSIKAVGIYEIKHNNSVVMLTLYKLCVLIGEM